MITVDATLPAPVFASGGAAAENIDAWRGRLVACLADLVERFGTFAGRRLGLGQRREPLTHESVALDLENRRIAAELRADSQRAFVARLA
ncbi:hypothetical protein EV379_0143 [Microterricola gilva]|uniref:Uncharacterized protein n=1 Tax=Microterricola gilva TaxID=393267 RepID=A0A4Q8AHQ1_9MICO|nr:hypothetical protein [Microterricola gilva]RZU63854.1 hypothetical protein EV379_0143 [Microterricola gilva]